MPEVFVAKVDEFSELGRRIVSVGRTEVGVFRVNGKVVAYESRCPHAGGPTCRGKIMPRVRVHVDEHGAVGEEYFDYEELHIVCPWHGWEFNILTGECVSNPRFALRECTVIQRGDELYVHM